MCLVTGTEQTLGTKHPARLRHGGDKAKLISANDTAGFTYLGRFTDSGQACAVGYETSQKAHSALRWLIQRQGFRNDDQTIVAWEISGKTVPSPMRNSRYAFWDDDEWNAEFGDGDDFYRGDFGQVFARKLNDRIAGYRRALGSADDIVVMGMDSATPGRMAVTYYRELTGSEFMERLEAWHKDYAWLQNYSKETRFLGAPAPREIAEAVYGRPLDAKIGKATVSRLLPCVMDGAALPSDILRSVCRRAAGRVGMEHWEWEKVLGIACGLFRGFHKERGYRMSLETERNSRDYLYGRLLPQQEVWDYSFLIRKLHDRFKEQFGTIYCRDIFFKEKELNRIPVCLETYKKGAILVTQLLLDAPELLRTATPDEMKI